MNTPNKLILCGRFWEGKQIHTALFEIDSNDSIMHILNLNTALGGDMAYPGLVALDKSNLLCSYYFGNRTTADIYLAKIAVQAQLIITDE
ncbi:MAG: hypothetical protein LBQ22_07460 [Bacteroidales bacterium]|nr:hypothetical protein [Bacteroidales bacterium]